MQRVVIDEPYEFVPPVRGRFWSKLMRCILKPYLRRAYGICDSSVAGGNLLRESIDAGHGIVIAPNHCRLSDPLSTGLIHIVEDLHTYAMASWHTFKQDWLQTFVTRRLGGFSIYREGTDRQSLNFAIDVLANAERPLLIFAEGFVSRMNDVLMPLLEGVSFIARRAARLREKQTPAGRVVVHPLAMYYEFQGDVADAVTPVLDRLERRFSWQPQSQLPLVERIRKFERMMLGAKELEFFGEPQVGDTDERRRLLIERMLQPMETEWLGKVGTVSVSERVKAIRTAILPDLVAKTVSTEESERRWRQLEDAYNAQQVSLYQSSYLSEGCPPEHLLEYVEKFEEDLTDTCTVHSPFKLHLNIGEAIEVSPQRPKGKACDPLLDALTTKLTTQLAGLRNQIATSRGSVLWETPSPVHQPAVAEQPAPQPAFDSV